MKKILNIICIFLLTFSQSCTWENITPPDIVLVNDVEPVIQGFSPKVVIGGYEGPKGYNTVTLIGRNLTYSIPDINVYINNIKCSVRAFENSTLANVGAKDSIIVVIPEDAESGIFRVRLFGKNTYSVDSVFVAKLESNSNTSSNTGYSLSTIAYSYQEVFVERNRLHHVEIPIFMREGEWRTQEVGINFILKDGMFRDLFSGLRTTLITTEGNTYWVESANVNIKIPTNFILGSFIENPTNKSKWYWGGEGNSKKVGKNNVRAKDTNSKFEYGYKIYTY